MTGAIRHEARPGPGAILVATVATLAPIWILAVRVGVRGMIPVGDTAIMALRAPDVLGSGFPLVGMPASSASAADVVHFPGAWQLYWLAVPVKVLGPTWGTVLAMAALNSVWILLAVWLVARNLESAQALVVVAAIGVFCWSVGTGMLIDAWPLKMVLVPFLCVVVAAWFTAAGDRAALVVLAVAANYAWLDHLVLGIAVPLVAAVGCAAMVIGWVRTDRTDPGGRRARRRGRWRSVLAAGAVTVVMWLPALVEQVTNHPGNLRLLLAGSPGAAPAIRSWTAAVHVVASVVGRPPFWFRGTLTDPTFYRVHHTGAAVGSATWFDIVVGVVVVGVLVALAVSTLGRRDRVGLALVVVAAAALVASLATTYLAPVTTALVPEYLYSVWVTAMITWTCVVVVTIRLVPVGSARNLGWIGLGVAVIFALANVPMSHTGYTATPTENELARDMSDTVITEVRGSEPVGVTMANLFGNANYLSALLVQMRQAGVAFCYPTPNTSLYDFIPDCDDPATTVVIAEQSAHRRPPGTVVFDEPVDPGASTRPVAALGSRIEAWLATRSTLTLTPAARRAFLGTMVPRQLEARVSSLVATTDGDLTRLADDPAFADLILLWWDRADARADPMFVDQPLSPSDLHRWAADRRAADLTLWVTRRP